MNKTAKHEFILLICFLVAAFLALLFIIKSSEASPPHISGTTTKPIKPHISGS